MPDPSLDRPPPGPAVAPPAPVRGDTRGAVERPDTPALRRLVLACAVLDDVDLEPYGGGVVLRGGPPVEVTWRDLRRSVAGADPASELAHARVLRVLLSARACADLGADALAACARPVGLAVDHVLHPGLSWVQRRVLGEALDLGLGFLGIGDDPDRVELVPAECLRSAGHDPTAWWPAAERYLERMGTMAAHRLARDRTAVLRPMGDCDVVTLLGARSFREALVGLDAAAMQAVAVPMRTRGWLDLARIDPAFVLAASSLTPDVDRGFTRPLLVTRDEVTLPVAGGDNVTLALKDPAAADPVLPAVRWR